MTIQEQFDKHRAEVVITCVSDCWCWDVESLLAALAEKDKTMKGSIPEDIWVVAVAKYEEEIATLKEELAADRRATKHTMEEMQALLEENTTLTAERDRLLEIPCPWPDDIWTMTDEKYVEAVPDPTLRTVISGFLMRCGWELFRQEALRGEEE